MRFTTILFAAAAARAADSVFGLSTCGTRCFYQTSEIINCQNTDYACQCANFDSRFYPQYSSCLIEGCIGETNDISSASLKSHVCKLATAASSDTDILAITISSTLTTAPPPFITGTASMDTSGWGIHTRSTNATVVESGSLSRISSGVATAIGTGTGTDDVRSGVGKMNGWVGVVGRFMAIMMV